MPRLKTHTNTWIMQTCILMYLDPASVVNLIALNLGKLTT